MAMDEWVWLYHPDTRGTFRCPPEAVEAWCARGWLVLEPQPDGDASEPVLPEPATTDESPEPQPAAAPAVVVAAKTTTNPARVPAAGDTEEER
jgi:hypothetical protein